MLTGGRRRRTPGRGRPVSILLARFAAGVAVIERGERRIGIVLFGSKTDAFGDARKIARAAARAGAIDAAT